MIVGSCGVETLKDYGGEESGSLIVVIVHGNMRWRETIVITNSQYSNTKSIERKRAKLKNYEEF